MLVWDMEPIAVTIGPVAIRWYGVLFALAFVTGYQLMALMSRLEGRDPASLERLFVAAVLGTVVGARLGHCLFYDPGWYLAHPLDIVKIWEGGLASHGGAVGLIAGVGVARWRDPTVDVRWILHRLPIPAAVGGACIRLGNFCNSEIVGIPAQVPWAVIFVRLDPMPRHPVQLYEAGSYAAVAMLLGFIYWRYPRHRDVLLGLFLVLVFGSRIVWEMFKAPQSAWDATSVWSTGQLLSVPFVLVGIGLVIGQARGWLRR